eukprot:gnl/TRDRNA2_/TRDRNA2_157413_c0_seq1.p1 gnl/TRDRNA2_/TRDRNA2_157413_c0~~gnl/TRDRNA2_/TRDRNA2_157413_c0_seq1.p1  ORF type:complete len:514 (-),score=66.92 gnl/TRDRNA2_/TRDRNA2_157413_c0_seq1:66-1607(-)
MAANEDLRTTVLLGTCATAGTVVALACVAQRLAALHGAVDQLGDLVRAQQTALASMAETVLQIQDEQMLRLSTPRRRRRRLADRGAYGRYNDLYHDDLDMYYGMGHRRFDDSRYDRYYDPYDRYASFDRRRGSGFYDSLDWDDYYNRYDDYGSSYGAVSSSYISPAVQKGLQREIMNRTRILERGLRQQVKHHVSGRPPRDVAWSIPRIVHQTWKTKEVPMKFFDHLASWRRLHRHWRFEFWDDKTGRLLVERTFPEYASAYRRMSGIKQADVARIVYLYVYGGVYADIDVEAVAPMDELLEAAEDAQIGLLLGEENFVHSVLLERKSMWLVSNAVMASARGHPFWLGVLKEIFQATWCGDDPVQCTGPRLVDRLSWQYLRDHKDQGTHGYLARLPYAYFSPAIARWNAGNMVKACVDPVSTYLRSFESRRRRLQIRACKSLHQALAYPLALRRKQTYAVHHWQCSWCREDEGMRREMHLDEVVWLVGNESIEEHSNVDIDVKGIANAVATDL